MDFPQRISTLLRGARGEIDRVGMSGAGVILYPDMVLKISPEGESARREAEMTKWLRGKLPVPEVIACECAGGRQFLLMTRLPGVMLCDRSLLGDGRALAELLARAIIKVREVDARDCPWRADIETMLALARRRVERGEVDIENTDPSTFGPGGFKDPEHLLMWLEDNRPEEDRRFTHGDMCLPNILTKNGQISGLLDLGGVGVGDPWRDIAIARRSLHDNTDGCHGHAHPGFDADVLFDILGVRPDREKLRYYLLLDELF